MVRAMQSERDNILGYNNTILSTKCSVQISEKKNENKNKNRYLFSKFAKIFFRRWVKMSIFAVNMIFAVSTLVLILF